MCLSVYSFIEFAKIHFFSHLVKNRLPHRIFLVSLQCFPATGTSAAAGGILLYHGVVPPLVGSGFGVRGIGVGADFVSESLGDGSATDHDLDLVAQASLGDGVDDVGDYGFRGDILRLGLVGEPDTVPHHLVAHGPHVLRNHIPPPLDEGIGLRGKGQGYARAGRSAVGNEVLQGIEAVVARGPRGIHDVNYVPLDLLIHIHVPHDTPRPHYVLRLHDGLGPRELPGIVHPHYQLLFILPRVIHHHLQHEPVHLRLGKRIGTLLFDGVLGGHHEEWFGQRIGLVAYGHLPLLHRLEQGALDLGRGTVDLIRKDEVGEDGTFVDYERPVLLGIDEGAGKVGGKKVRGELDPAELGVDGLGQGVDGQGLGKAGDTLEEDVAVCQEAYQQVVHQMLLPHYHLPHLQRKQIHERAFFLDAVVQFLDARTLHKYELF